MHRLTPQWVTITAPDLTRQSLDGLLDHGSVETSTAAIEHAYPYLEHQAVAMFVTADRHADRAGRNTNVGRDRFLYRARHVAPAHRQPEIPSWLIGAIAVAGSLAVGVVSWVTSIHG